MAKRDTMDDRPSWGGNRGTRQERGYGSRWDKLRVTILKRDNYLCQQCQREGRVTPLKVKPYDHAVDHVVPKAKGGSDHPSNLQAICAPCHKAKTTAEGAQGKGYRPPRIIGADGWPVE